MKRFLYYNIFIRDFLLELDGFEIIRVNFYW